MFRSLALVAAVAVGFALVGGHALAAEEKTIDNLKIGKVDGTKITVESDKGDKHTAEVAGDAKITLDGKAAKLSELKEGTKVKVTIKKDDGKITVLKIEASSK